MSVRLAAAHAPAMDGLRGLAALMVVASHASGLGLHLLPGLNLTGIGKHGVYLFFVLSAFLLSWQWLSDWPRAGQRLHRVGDYLIGRFARIFPLYTLVLVAAWMLGGHGLGVGIDTPALWQHLTLQRGDGIYWSIPVEFHYYFILPLVAALLAWRAAPGLQLASWGVLLALVLWLFPAAQAPENGDRLGPYLPVFLCGSLAAWLHLRLTERRKAVGDASRLAIGDLLFLLVLALSTPALLRHALPMLGNEALHRSFLAWGLVWGTVLLALLHGRMPLIHALLSSAQMCALGRWSFGLYLLHLPALYLARLLPLPGMARAWIGLMLGVGLASLSYRLVERPALRIARRWRRSLSCGA